MEADDRQPPARLEASGIRRRAISSDFSSSFTAIRRAWKVRVAGSIRSLPRRGHALPHQFGQIGGRLDRPVPPALDNGLGDAPAVSLFAVVVDQVGQMPRARAD